MVRVMDPSKEVANLLLAASDQLAPLAKLHGYRTWWDEDLGEYVVDVLIELPEPEGETWDLSLQDEICGEIARSLGSTVAFSYCDFRTADGILRELADRTDPPWTRLLVDGSTPLRAT